MSTGDEESEEPENTSPKTVWVKFHKVRNIYYVNLKKTKQLVAITRGCHILFIDPVTEEETIFRAVNAEKGEGVQCMDIARKSKIFAFAEKCMNPRIMVYSIPDLTCLNTLCGGSLNGYLSIAFSEKELLVSLGTYPDFLITIWNWRNGEKLVTQESVLREENQMLKCNFGSVFSVSQMPKHSETLSVWNVHLCYSVCRLVRDDVTLPLSTGSRMCDMLWSPDGILYILEIFGDIFAIEGEQRNVSLAIKWDGIRGHTTPCMAWHKNGIVLAGPDGTIKLYTVVARRRASISKGPAPTGPAWKLVWTAHPKYPFAALCGAEHHGIHELYGFTVRGELYSLSENNLNQVKNFGAGIKDFYFIYPQMDYIVTLNNAGNLMVWYKGTGQMVAGMHLGQNCHNMHASPAAPLLAVGRSDGYIILVSVEKPTEPTIVGELPLCLDDIGLLAFTSSGKHLLAGTKTTGHIFVLKAPPCKNVFVMAYVRLPTQITDAAMFEEGQKNIRVAFIIKTLHCCERGGNEIHIFKCRIHNSAEITKPLKLELIINTGFNYVSITHNHVVPEQLLAIPHRSRHIHVFVLERVESEDGMPTLRPRLKVALASGHQIRSTTVRLARDVVVTWGADGLVVLRCAATLRPLAAITGHHRADGGVARARTDPGATMLLSLGYDGAFVATDMRAPGFDDIEGYPEPAKSEPKEEKSKSKSRSVVSGMFGTENDEEKLTEYVLIGSDRSVNWLQKRKEMKDKEDALQQGNKRKNYQKMLSDVKKQALTLFEANLEGPEEEKLPIGEFDLDDETRRKKIENFNEIMGDMIIRMNAEISARNALAAKIKGRTWDKMIVKTQHIHVHVNWKLHLCREVKQGAISAFSQRSKKLDENLIEMGGIDAEAEVQCLLQAFLGQFFVENYAILQPDLELQKALSALEKRMRLTWKTSKKDCFYPWMPKVNYDKVRMGSIAVEDGDRKTVDLTADETASNIESELLDANNVDVFRGSASHKYVSVSPYHCSQFELSTFHHVHQEVVLLRQITQNLQEYFNKEFKKMLEIKEKELGLLAEKNNRRRHLLSELNISGIPVDDVEWDPLEEPERLMIVKENEVSVPPYLTKSEEELRARKAAEAEALRLALLADDFRERALITMMHGVLELRWEDKIKKDVPKPKCLLEKLPEEWNEEEIRLVRDYDQKVLNLMDQRRLYRKICGKEYEEILQNQKESMLKFDKRLQQLLLLKMEIQSCIDQENLKILRGRMKIHERMKLENQEHSILKEIENTDKEINELQAEIHNLLEAKRNCRHEYDSLLFRERNFDKSFKKEFRDYHGPIASHLYKLYKRRPKVHQKAQMSVSLLEELSRCTMQPGELPSYLPSDCLDFLNALEDLDQHSHVPHGASEAAWNSLCKLRRSKIECELKIKAMALQLAECDSTINVFNKTLSILRDKLIMFNKNLKDIREEKLEVIHNVQLQLVMKQGIVEIEDTSDFGNFTDCVLINRSVVEQINSLILEAGDKKLKAMQKVTNFHRVIMCKEWEHKKLRMIIEDLKDKLNYIDNVRLTRDLQNLLKMKASGMAVDSGKENMDRQIIAYKQAYDKIIKTTKENLEELNRRVRRAKKSNFHLDKNIIDLNVDVNELMLKRDAEQDEEQDKCRRQRMKLIILRGHAVRKIQQQFHEILLLQTELELLRLRTYPTLKYNPIE